MAGGASGNGNAATNEHHAAGYALGVRLFVLALSCAAVALLATALFFLLHHLGNQLPYDLAAQRFKAEFESDRPDPGHAKGYKTMLEYCATSAGVLAGAKRASVKKRFEFSMRFVSGRAVVTEPSQSSAAAAPLADERASRSRAARDENAFRNAVLLKTFQVEDSTICGQLEAAANGAVIPNSRMLTRYWWGGKALYAIALRYGSAYEIRNLIRIGTHVAYALLAISLLLLSPKMLLPAGPLLVFGAFFSGIEYWAGVANGLPYLWTVLFAAGLALLTRLTRRHVGSGAAGAGAALWSGTAPVYCFAAGTVSSYLWLGDGHTFLAVTWIGVVVWFGYDSLNVAERARRALSCIVLYGAGIAVCYALGQVVKAMLVGEVAWLVFWNGLVGTVAESAGGASKSLSSHPLVFLDDFYAAYWPGSWPSGVFPTFVAAFSLAASLAFAAFEKRRGRSGLLWDVLWIVGLMSSCSLTFLILEDIQYRTARYVHVPLALCLSCLFLSLRSLRLLRTTHWRMSLASAGKLAAALLGLLVAAWALSWYLATFKSRAVDKVIESVENLRPIASSVFDVYLDEDRLIYVKEECSDEDVDTWFFLHLHPADVGDLHYGRQPHGFANFDFAFERFGVRGGGRCAVVRRLPICFQPPCSIPSGWPPYEVVVLHTGQYVPDPPPGTPGRRWSERVVLPGPVDKMIRSVDDIQPAASSTFDVYLDEGLSGRSAYGDILPAVDRLVYVKEECAPEDVGIPFFLHLYPADIADLPPHRQPHGFDNLDFTFETFGFRDGGRCAAVRLLPEYEVVVIQTGQYVHGRAPEWSERIALSAVSPAFEVHLDEGRVVYVKEECSHKDVENRFFLHVYPVDVVDLPAPRRALGFDTLDFDFEKVGLRSGGRCTAERLLPEYGVVAIETGQYVRGKDRRVWERRIDLANVK